MIFHILKNYTEDLFIIKNEEEFLTEYNNNFSKYLCNVTKNCVYPCGMDKDTCKLIIKERDIYGNYLKEKIINSFIEKLLIYKIEKIDTILKENIDINLIKLNLKENELFYTFIEYEVKDDDDKESLLLNEIFKKKSKYIKEETKLLTSKKKIFVKQDKIPNYLTKLFGKNTIILNPVIEANSDFLVFERALLKSGIFLFTDQLKNILKNTIDQTDKELLDKINEGEYSLTSQDFSIIVNNIFDFAVLIINNDEKKDISKYEFIYNERLTDLTPIIIFYKENNEKLSNIVINKKYSFNFIEKKANQKLLDLIFKLI